MHRRCCSRIFGRVALLAIVGILVVEAEFPQQCSRREPPGYSPHKSSGSNGFKITISGNPEKYVPGEVYTVTLQGKRPHPYTIHKFIAFMLVVEPREGRGSSDPSAVPPDVGFFQLFGDGLSKFSDDCPYAIVQTSSVPKSEIQVMWTAPPQGSGCVYFRAMVAENRDTWYMDDGDLTKEICEEEQESIDEQPELVDECCACDEAKYEVIFEGLWSKHTHPKDFPQNEWLTHFSDIIGASHSADFRMWEYGGYASEGVRQVAEWGATKKLESELKAESNKIRTIIKARGLWYPNVNGKTFAVFRVDKKHHLMSLLSMLGPSPDWIVGVSALELCLKNCSWVTEKMMNLYPWDAGTDSGITYMSANAPTIPQERIRRITTTNPNNPESPFYDPSGAPMKPVARLIVSRQRIYEKSCEGPDPTIPTDPPTRPECAVTPWTEFTPCSVTCGQGIQTRTRNYINEKNAQSIGCLIQLTESRMCDATCVGNISCETTSWSEWSTCSVTCGKGHRTRMRKFKDHMARKVCNLDLIDKEMCMAPDPECKTPPDPPIPDPKCAVTQWSEWSPCTVTCGKGMRVRTRLYLSPASLSTCNVELMQKAPCMAERQDCSVDYAEAKEICMQPKEVGPCRGYFPRWYYDASKGMCFQFIYGGCRGNKNNFERYAECNRMCEVMLRAPISTLSTMATSPTLPSSRSDQPVAVVDCVTTPWSDWSACSQTCGNGRKNRRRMIMMNPQNGGKPCPRKLVQRRKCKDNPPCGSPNEATAE